MDEIAGSTCLFVQRPEGVDLLLPPVPCDAGRLKTVIDKIASHQGGRLPRILWLDARDAQYVDTEQFALRDKDAEYVYDPSQIIAARGRRFRDVRKRVRRFERAHEFHFRALTAWDVPDCLALLKHWASAPGASASLFVGLGIYAGST